MEHPQTLINHSQYGTEEAGKLGAAAYKLSYKEPEGRGVYSFCMCPGGYVVNASSEEGYLAVNGMSYHARDGKNANSAIVVTVTPEDFGSAHPLAGIAFQRRLEQAAFSAGGGKIPVQRLEDFEKNVPTRELTAQGWEPCMKGAWQFANLRPVFPEEISRSLLEGMKNLTPESAVFRARTLCFPEWRAGRLRRCGFSGEKQWKVPWPDFIPAGREPAMQEALPPPRWTA